MTQTPVRPLTHTLRRHVEVPMSDGVRLRADIWLPEGSGPFPVLLERIPYDKSSSFQTQHIVGLEIVRALDAGFAVVVQDTRGRYTSDGVFDAFVSEAADGRDTIAWIRAQDFSAGGPVFMYGASYVGATQLLAASSRPEGLAGIAPQLTTSDYHEAWTYRGGALQLGFVLLWVIESLAGPDLLRKPEPDAAGAALLAELSVDPYASLARLPIRTPELLTLAPSLADWLDHPTRDRFWDAIDPSAAYADMDLAGLHIGGWNDIFADGTLRNFAGLSAHAASDTARRRQYLVMGPWSHGNPTAWQGEHWHGYAAEAASIDVSAMHLEFFSALAAGRDPDLPRALIFFTGADEWRRLPDWPPPGVTPLRLEVEGRSLTTTPGEPGSLRFVSDPSDPVPTVGGATFLPGLLLGRNSGPRDQAAVESRADVLVLSSDVLEEDLTVAGEVVLELSASSSAVDCDWTARLTDVDPAGRSLGVVDGVLRSRYRNGGDAEPLVPGARERFRVVLGSTAHVFRAGHRVRLQIAGSNFPRFDRNPQSWIEPVDAVEADFVKAEQTVFTGPGATRLVLPVVALPPGGER